MYCAKCGKELKDGTVFCAYCGNKVLDNTRDPSTISQRENTHHTSIISPRVIGILAVVLMVLLVVVFIKSILFGSLKYKKGEIITLGKYEQDGDVGNGEEPIEWIVLDSGRNGTLVISRYILDNKGYNHPNEEITWADCTLRKWLNDDFYNSAFSASEKRQIKKTKLTNPNYKYNDTPGGPSTNDKVFLLSFDELCEYYELTPVDEERDLVFGENLIAEGTPYAIGKNLRTQTIDDETLEELKELGYSGSCKGLNGGEWFLRSPGINSLRVCGVDSYGRTDTSGKAVFDKGIRPVLWLK